MTYCAKCGHALPEGAKYCPVCGTAMVAESPAAQPTATAQAIAPRVKLAFWGERFVAWLIDVIIIGVVAGILTYSIYLRAWRCQVGLIGFPSLM